jgi:hypothetical protein
MRYFTTKGGLGILGLALLGGMGYSVLRAVSNPTSLDRPASIAGHDPNCLVCRLPLHGRDGASSQLGPQGPAIEGETALRR